MGQYVITMAIFSASENLALRPCRAKFFVDPATGEVRLMSIAQASRPVFRVDGYEPSEDERPEFFSGVDEEVIIGELVDPDNFDSQEQNRARAVRRAKRVCFDLCTCNAFDTFLTLTFNKEYIDRTDYHATYAKIKNWLSNGVQRRGLRYLAVPEYHKDGEAIHFHLLANSDALQLVDSGHKRHGKPVYNVKNWQWGFSTAIPVDGEEAHIKTAKYIVKYMGKQMGAKIGGRFYLAGGDLARPFFDLADTPEEFGVSLSDASYVREIAQDWGSFKEWSFL